MNREKYQQVKRIFQSAVEIAPAERSAFLDQTCENDSLRRAVETLLNSVESEFLEESPLGKIAKEATGDRFAAGQRFGHYEIRRKIGAGGMGEVYLATDTRLQRPVAIKFLLSSGSAFDANGEKRLLREAQSAAALDHPNICAVHEVGTSDECSFIVMQYVEGETLDARIKRAALTVAESVAVTLNIADALTEAHSRGIVHRDIKPSNVIIGLRGQVKVLDFSLAKKIFAEEDDMTQSLLSQAGVIAGTIAYMSPEQARGQEIDARSDVWSLGVVLYEMLTGRLPFAGESKSDVIAAILQNESAPLKNYLTTLPAEGEQIVSKALQKNRAARYQTTKEFSADLRRLQSRFGLPSQIEDESPPNENAAEGQSVLESRARQSPEIYSAERFELTKQTVSETSPATGENEARSSVEYVAAKSKTPQIIFLTFFLAIISGTTIWQFVKTNTVKSLPFTAESRAALQISTLFNTKRKPGGGIDGLGFSPDGNLLVFALRGEGKSSIYIKQLSGGEPVKTTDGKWMDEHPVWSPDGQRIAFLSDRDNQKGIWAVSFMGGIPILLRAVDTAQDMELIKWSADGSRIYYVADGVLSTIDLVSGELTQIVADPKLSCIAISPDEKWISYVKFEDEKEQIWIQPLSGGVPRRIIHSNNHNWNPVWFPDNQRLAYNSDQNGNFQIYVVEVNGGEPTQITFGDVDTEYQAVSPDGLKIAYMTVNDEANVYSYNLDNHKESVQTTNIGMQLFPDISPDGKQFIFQSMRVSAKFFDSPIKIKTLDSDGEPAIINPGGSVAKWSPDGKHIAFLRKSGEAFQLWKASVNGQNEKLLTTGDVYTPGFSTTPYNLFGNWFGWSPDSRRIAYVSNKSGHFNLWTISADNNEGQMETRNDDGNLRLKSPLWSLDGSRIAYVSETNSPLPGEKPQSRVSIVASGQSATVFQTALPLHLLGWSASGAEIYVGVKNGADITLFKISADSSEKIKQIAKFPNAHLHGIKLSPDSKQIVYTARRGENDNIYVSSADGGGESRQLTANLDSTLFYSGLIWSPDGKNLYYSKQSGGLQISMITNPKQTEEK